MNRCQIPCCKAEAKYGLYWITKDDKVWVEVCELHEKVLGAENEKQHERRRYIHTENQ